LLSIELVNGAIVLKPIRSAETKTLISGTILDAIETTESKQTWAHALAIVHKNLAVNSKFQCQRLEIVNALLDTTA
jgi:hypothetical protein